MGMGFAILCACLFFMGAYVPQAVASKAPPPPIPAGCDNVEKDTKSGGATNDMVTNLVSCVDTNIRSATVLMNNQLSTFMSPIVAALSVFAIAFHGIKILGGEGRFTASTMSLLLRLALVNFFFSNLGGMADKPFIIMDDLANVVASNWTPWAYVDKDLGDIFGYSSDGTKQLYNGILALLAAAIFSGTPGVMMTSVGFIVLSEIIKFVFDLTYTYLQAVLAVSFYVLISPLIIPLALFQYSEKYFSKWLSGLMGAMLIPTFLFGFLSFTWGAFDARVKDMLTAANPAGYQKSGADYFSPYGRSSQSAYSWMRYVDPGLAKKVEDNISSSPVGAKLPTVPSSNIAKDPKAANASVVNLLSYWGLNFGTDNETTIKNIIAGLVPLWIYASVMLGIIRKIPALALEIAGAGIALNVGGQSLKQKMAETLDNLKFGTGAAIGTMVGGAAAKAVTKSAEKREASALVGAAIGVLVVERL